MNSLTPASAYLCYQSLKDNKYAILRVHELIYLYHIKNN